MNSKKYYIGLDLGQSQDFTAIAIVEHKCVATGERSLATYEWEVLKEWNVRYIVRLPLKTAYTDVVTRVQELVRRLADDGKKCELVVDATGVGRPVVDTLRRAGLKIPIYAVTISSGSSVSKTDFGYTVPKRDLVSNLLILLQSGRLRIAEGLPEAQMLVKEFMNFRAKITPAGNDSYEGWREGDHDDMVLAVALACWRARDHGRVGFGSDVIYGVTI